MDTLHYTTHDSAIGTLLLIGGNRGLCNLVLLEDETAEQHLARLFPQMQITPLPGFFATATQAIDRYLAKGEALKLPVDMRYGTALQRSVWLAIARIPSGETVSYSALAERVGFPRAVRAVASACGANPVPLVVPCHRVVGKDGGLGGFSLGGVHIKERLLALEAPHREESVAAA